MDRRVRDDLVMIGAGLLGVAVGHFLKSRQAPEGPPAAKAELQAVTLPSLLAASGLSHRLGDRLHVADDETWQRAALTFATSAALIYFSDHLGRFLPNSTADVPQRRIG